jgi:hypothetical protein
VFVRITNPYDVPVTITRVETELRAEFLEPDKPDNRRGFLRNLRSFFAKEVGVKTLKFYARSALENSSDNGSKEGRALSQDPETGPPPPVVLQPGNSHLAEFTLKTRKKTQPVRGTPTGPYCDGRSTELVAPYLPFRT